MSKRQDKFASCSINELKMCLRHRIETIRQIRKFKKDELSKKYNKIRSISLFQILINKRDIQYIIKRIRELKDKKSFEEYIESFPKPEIEKELANFGYWFGDYYGKCTVCNNEMMGVGKKSFRCKECALEAWKKSYKKGINNGINTKK